MSPKKSRRDKGDGGLYKRADGMWIGAVQLPAGADGKRRRKTVSSKDYKTAAGKLRDLRRQIQDNPDAPSASMTVEKWLDHWLLHIVTPNARPKTRDGYRDDVRLHITPAIGRHRLDRLAPAHVRSMDAAIIAKGRSSTTALRCHTTLGVALNDAMREGHIHRNVAALVKRPAKAVNSRGALTVDQAVHLMRHAAENLDPLASMYATALFTGGRRGEVIGLQDDRVTDRIDFAWQLQRLRYTHGCGDACGRKRGSCPDKHLEIPPGFEFIQLDGGLCLTRPKSSKGVRVIPLVEPLASILAAIEPGPHGLLWTTKTGHPIDPRDASAAWKAAVKAAGLPPVPLHAARHTTATLLRAAGVPVDIIQQILGHSSAVTSQGYIHLDDTQMRHALEGLSGTLAG